MYDPLLDTFIVVADCGSFTKASEKIFISPTAIMKQMNSLESRLDLKLIERTSSGIRLTPAGEKIYNDAKYIIEYSNNAVRKAKELEYENEKMFCVGTSLLNPAKPFMDLWYKVNDDFRDYKLHLVPFDDNHENILSVIESLGVKFDFLVGVCDSRRWLKLCNFLPLGRYRKMAAVSREHHLANKDFLKLTDLYGETLVMVKKGDSGVNDFLRNDLEQNHPQINIEDASQFYDLSVFNYCAENNKVLLMNECWKDVHPGLVTIPVDWDYSIPYGLMYSLNAPNDVLAFVESVKKVIKK